MYSKFSLTNRPNQTFTLLISGDKKSISLFTSLSYNSMAKYWMLSFYDSSTNDPIIMNLPLLYGHDLLEQYQYLNIGSVVLANSTGNIKITAPDDQNLSDFYLIWKL